MIRRPTPPLTTNPLKKTWLCASSSPPFSSGAAFSRSTLYIKLLSQASVPSRALLGLKALYAAVNVNRRERARRSSGSKAPSTSSRGDGSSAMVSSPGAREVGAGSGGVVTSNQSAKRGGEGGGGAAGAARAGGWLAVPSPPQPPPPTRVSAEAFVAMPLLGHRYKYVSTIGTGRFSEVIRYL